MRFTDERLAAMERGEWTVSDVHELIAAHREAQLYATAARARLEKLPGAEWPESSRAGARAATALEAMAEAVLQALPIVQAVARTYMVGRPADAHRDGICVGRPNVNAGHEWVRRPIGFGADGDLSVCVWCHAELRDDNNGDPDGDPDGE